ncbi:uncharacterized protein LOC100711510 isoform X2 [Oreochromis niloticus]|uniref:uncharacterized protein LOC100711510 isoform X2 n=1 Tax=Oreochromis niloticus TaxID=8128 RepID=UPI000904D8CA|nr:uncharacterized protein LOC100711510 isoform X2 [Oreochromis niloticus]
MSQLSTHITAPSLFTGTHLDLHPALCPYRVTRLKMPSFILNPSLCLLQRDSASPHTGTSLLHQETRPVPSVEKDAEPELDCRQPVRAAVYKMLVCRRF